MSLPAIDPLTEASPPLCSSTRHMLVPPHDTDPLTASTEPRITILLWPVVQDKLPPTLTASRATTDTLHPDPVHDMLPLTFTASRATTDTLHPDPVKLADGIPNSIHSAEIVTDDDEAVI